MKNSPDGEGGKIFNILKSVVKLSPARTYGELYEINKNSYKK